MGNGFQFRLRKEWAVCWRSFATSAGFIFKASQSMARVANARQLRENKAEIISK